MTKALKFNFLFYSTLGNKGILYNTKIACKMVCLKVAEEIIFVQKSNSLTYGVVNTYGCDLSFQKWSRFNFLKSDGNFWGKLLLLFFNTNRSKYIIGEIHPWESEGKDKRDESFLFKIPVEEVLWCGLFFNEHILDENKLGVIVEA